LCDTVGAAGAAGAFGAAGVAGICITGGFTPGRAGAAASGIGRLSSTRGVIGIERPPTPSAFSTALKKPRSPSSKSSSAVTTIGSMMSACFFLNGLGSASVGRRESRPMPPPTTAATSAAWASASAWRRARKARSRAAPSDAPRPIAIAANRTEQTPASAAAQISGLGARSAAKGVPAMASSTSPIAPPSPAARGQLCGIGHSARQHADRISADMPHSQAEGSRGPMPSVRRRPPIIRAKPISHAVQPNAWVRRSAPSAPGRPNRFAASPATAELRLGSVGE
jgi:hypothetical protein